MTSTDELELAREVTELLPPLPSVPEIDEWRLRARGAHLVGEIAGTRLAGTGRNRMSRAAVVACLSVAGVVAAASTAAAYVAWAKPTNTAFARCYTSASLAEGAVGTDISQASRSGGTGGPTMDPAHAVDSCAAWWNLRLTGSPSSPPGADGKYPGPVPDLVACVLDDGVVGVFPGSPDTCRALGLPRLDLG